MPINIVKKDITTSECDAIVNPTDHSYSGGGGTDFAVHCAAGPELDAFCRLLPPLDVGEAVSTPGFNLPCRHIIHTVGPVWKGGRFCEAVLLRSCYLNSLFKAASLGARSIAFPLISAGTFRFPKDQVLRIAIDAITDFLFTSAADLRVDLCIFDKEAYELSNSIELKQFLDSPERSAPGKPSSGDSRTPPSPGSDGPSSGTDLADWLKHQDESFALTLLRLIDKKGMTDVECYKKANVTKSTFSKVRTMKDYKPSKATVLAFAIALHLNLEETRALLKTAGFTLSRSSIFDMIVEFYIANGIYDIFEVNAALYKYDQNCLGC